MPSGPQRRIFAHGISFRASQLPGSRLRHVVGGPKWTHLTSTQQRCGSGFTFSSDSKDSTALGALDRSNSGNKDSLPIPKQTHTTPLPVPSAAAQQSAEQQHTILVLTRERDALRKEGEAWTDEREAWGKERKKLVEGLERQRELSGEIEKNIRQSERSKQERLDRLLQEATTQSRALEQSVQSLTSWKADKEPELQLLKRKSATWAHREASLNNLVQNLSAEKEDHLLELNRLRPIAEDYVRTQRHASNQKLVADRKAQRLAREHRRRISERETYADLRRACKVVTHLSHENHRQMRGAVSSPGPVEQIFTYWMWANRKFQLFRMSLGQARDMPIFANVEFFLRSKIHGRQELSPLIFRLTDSRLNAEKWQRAGHTARLMSRALRYSDLRCTGARFRQSSIISMTDQKVDANFRSLRKPLLTEDLRMSDEDFLSVELSVNLAMFGLRTRLEAVSELMWLRWVRRSPPAEQIAFAEAGHLFATTDASRLGKALNKIKKAAGSAFNDLSGRITSMVPDDVPPRVDELIELIASRRYAQERLQEDSTAALKSALFVIRDRFRRLKVGLKKTGELAALGASTERIGSGSSRSAFSRRPYYDPSDFAKRAAGQTHIKHNLMRSRGVALRNNKLRPTSAMVDDSLAETSRGKIRFTISSVRGPDRVPLKARPRSDQNRGSGPQFTRTAPLRSPVTVPDPNFGDELDFQISPSVLHEMKSASRVGDEKFWSHTLFKSSTGANVRVHYCTNLVAAENVARSFAEENVLGFDMEWESGAQPTRSAIKDNVSVIQLASEDRVAIFHLALFRGDTAQDLMPTALREILESQSIRKAGVNVAGDFTRLRKCFSIEGKGLFELSHLYKLIRYSEIQPELINKIPVSLDEQIQHVFGLPLMKGAVRVSAWAGKLSGEQISYAVTDAYAGFRLYDEMDRRRRAMKPCPPLPALYELAEPIILGNGMPPPKKLPISKRTNSAADVNMPPATAVHNEAAESNSDLLEWAPTTQQEIVSEGSCDETDDGDEATQPMRFSAGGDQRLVSVDAWLDAYRATKIQEGRYTHWAAKPAAIRAYALWHQHSMSTHEVAQLLRDPPLKPATVNSYIVEAIAFDRQLSFDPERLRAVFDSLPRVVTMRFKGLARAIGM